MVTETNQLGQARSFVYDAVGNLIGRLKRITSDYVGVTAMPQVIAEHDLDLLGNRQQLLVKLDGLANYQNDYLYDAASRMTRVEQKAATGGGGPVVKNKRADFAYDLASRLASITRSVPDPVMPWQNVTVVKSDFTWDGASRLTGLRHHQPPGPMNQPPGAGTLANYTYTYYTGSTPPPDRTYNYDLNGNRTTAGYQTTANNRLAQDGTYSYTYDGEGNRTRKTKISTGEYTDYAWDHRNRLTRVTENSAGGQTLKLVLVRVRAFDRRIWKLVSVNGATGTVESYFYDGEHIGLRFDDAGQVSNRYLHGPMVDMILADEQISAGGQFATFPGSCAVTQPDSDELSLAAEGEADVDDAIDSLLAVDDSLIPDDPLGPDCWFFEDGGSAALTGGGSTIYWPLGDHLGSIRDVAIFDDPTRTTSMANHLVYDEYGQLISETNAAVDHIFGYTGREIDEETDLQFNRARYYDAAIGRWISEDPIGFAGGDANLNRYVGNGTTNATDPSGLIGDGHHIVPQFLWKLFGFDPDVYDIFDAKNARIDTPGGHNYTAHGTSTGYSGHVKDELDKELKKFMTKQELDCGTMSLDRQREFAKKFVDHIHNSTNPFIRGFNEAASGGIAAVEKWYKNFGAHSAHGSAVGQHAKYDNKGRCQDAAHPKGCRKENGKVAPIARSVRCLQQLTSRGCGAGRSLGKNRNR